MCRCCKDTHAITARGERLGLEQQLPSSMMERPPPQIQIMRYFKKQHVGPILLLEHAKPNPTLPLGVNDDDKSPIVYSGSKWTARWALQKQRL